MAGKTTTDTTATTATVGSTGDNSADVEAGATTTPATTDIAPSASTGTSTTTSASSTTAAASTGGGTATGSRSSAGNTGSESGSAKPSDVVLHLHGPKTRADGPKEGRANITHVAFNVKGGPVNVPVNEDLTVSGAVAEAVKAEELPAGYSWETPEQGEPDDK